MMKINELDITESFPAFITSKRINADKNELITLIHEHKNFFHDLLLKQGAFVFRNFGINDAADFAEVIEALELGDFVNYIGGDSPRDKVKDKVYTSTEAPPNLHIPLHQELSFMKNHPKHIYFYCEIEPDVGGSTIIGDARQILKAMNSRVTAQFQEKKLTYVSHYYYQSMIMKFVNRLQRSHKSWPEVFETQSKSEVETKCLANEFDWKWLKRDWLEIQQTRPATLTHPLTQENVWFNQAHLYDFNPKLLGLQRYLGAKLFYFRKSTRLHEIMYADKTQIPRKDIYHVLDVLNQNTVSFPWKQGDVMVLDNILSMHGRAPFSGKRRILTALTA
ncbi:MAG: TauD/TfdA family dioxygenase [Gammaproteobacteria bacterium]|nr:TauD/TfdA family dioxygenase [Gammaproteobacteria bacterium]